MKETIYLDNSATTKPCEEAIALMNKALTDNWGNPSSLHTIGINAEDAVISCREVCAKAIGSRSDEIYFTSGGTEANNLAINGAILAKAKRGNRIITTSIEHPSVAEAVKRFEEKGFEVIYLEPDSNGRISVDAFRAALNDKTILVSIMLVNNETGAIQPIKEISKIIKSSGLSPILHCDAVQAFGKLPIKVSELGVDILTFSGHKIHAPKGIGVLYKKKNLHILPLTFGGGQQDGLRPGTEPVPLIAALEGAVKALPDPFKKLPEITELRNYARQKLTDTKVVRINSPEDALPYVLNVSVPGWRSETLLHFLDSKGIFVSSGSACAKGGISPTLSAMKLDRKLIDSALRISFSRYNTFSDVDKLCEAIAEATTKLKRA